MTAKKEADVKVTPPAPRTDTLTPIHAIPLCLPLLPCTSSTPSPSIRTCQARAERDSQAKGKKEADAKARAERDAAAAQAKAEAAEATQIEIVS